MNWLGKIGMTLFFLGASCFVGLFICAFLSCPEYVFDILTACLFTAIPVGFILMFISVLYDRYKQLETEDIHPKV
jgi:hypothetical protein